VTPALFPCQAFPTACANQVNPHTHLSEVPNYGSQPNYVKAITDLLKIQWNPTLGNHTLALCAVNTPGVCDTSSAQVTSGTVWHAGGSVNPWNGPVFTPNWWWRHSLERVDFDYVLQASAAKIGLSFNLLGDGSIDEAIGPVFTASASAVISEGHYVPGTPKATCKTWGCPGYNTKPTYAWSEAALAYTSAGGNVSDNWAMYSYGYSAGPNFVGSDEFFNSLFEASEITTSDLHNATQDFTSNAVINAPSAGKAEANNRLVALYQLQDLSMLNIYFNSNLWAAYIQGWSGYAAIPSYGPDSGSGLVYTALNVGKGCYLSLTAQTCNGGTFNEGLGDGFSIGGGMNPNYAVLTVYDVDYWENIFDTPLGTPPTGFTAPLKFMNWMTKSYTVTGYTGTTPSGTGWFDYQNAANNGPTGTLAGDHFYKGEKITFNFLPNLYWSDGAAINAYDYNFSLYLSGLVAAPNSPYSASYGLLAGPTGMWESYINPTSPLTLTVYLNSTAAWNLAFMQVELLPAHIWAHGWNLLSAFNYPAAIDPTFTPVLAACSSNDNPCTGTWYNTTVLPTWMQALPNLYVGSGPFMQRTINEHTSTALLVRNPLYYRPYWQYSAYNSTYQDNVLHASYTLNVNVAPLLYDPSYCSSVDKICYVPITSDGGTIGSSATPTGWTSATAPAWQLVSATGVPLSGKGGALTCVGSTCSYTFVNAVGLAPGFNHVIVDIPYTFDGQSRVWYQSIGIYYK